MDTKANARETGNTSTSHPRNGANHQHLEKRKRVVAKWSHLPKPTLSTKNTPSLTHGPRKARKHFFMTLYNNTIGTITLNIKAKRHVRRKIMIN